MINLSRFHGTYGIIAANVREVPQSFCTVQSGAICLKPIGKAIADMHLRSGLVEKRTRLAVLVQISSYES